MNVLSGISSARLSWTKCHYVVVFAVCNLRPMRIMFKLFNTVYFILLVFSFCY